MNELWQTIWTQALQPVIIAAVGFTAAWALTRWRKYLDGLEREKKVAETVAAVEQLAKGKQGVTGQDKLNTVTSVLLGSGLAFKAGDDLRNQIEAAVAVKPAVSPK